MQSRVILLLWIISVLGCNSKVNDELEGKYLEYHENPIEDFDSMYIMRCQNYGIDNMRDSAKENQIRVLMGLPIPEKDTTYILMLKETIYGWEAAFNKYVFGELKNGKQIFTYKSETKREPDISWKDLLKEIKETGIYSISTKNKKQSAAFACGEFVKVEIVDKGRYGSFDFYDWTAIKDKTQLYKIEKLVELCRTHFGFSLLKLNIGKIKLTENCEVDTLSMQ